LKDDESHASFLGVHDRLHGAVESARTADTPVVGLGIWTFNRNLEVPDTITKIVVEETAVGECLAIRQDGNGEPRVGKPRHNLPKGTMKRGFPARQGDVERAGVFHARHRGLKGLGHGLHDVVRCARH
jgi:hypothetical protein